MAWWIHASLEIACMFADLAQPPPRARREFHRQGFRIRRRPAPDIQVRRCVCCGTVLPPRAGRGRPRKRCALHAILAAGRPSFLVVR